MSKRCRLQRASVSNVHFFPLMQEFIIHSPDFEASKFWVGNMGKTATHAVVFAQLYTPGGRCHGLHPFLVQVGAGFIPGVGGSGHVRSCFHHSWGQG